MVLNGLANIDDLRTLIVRKVFENFFLRKKYERIIFRWNLSQRCIKWDGGRRSEWCRFTEWPSALTGNEEEQHELLSCSFASQHADPRMP